MPSNADYTREYFQIIDELDGDIESRRAAFNYMQDSTAIVHHQVVASSFVPRLFNRKTYEVMKRTAETSHRILCKVIERYRADEEYRKLFDFDERLVELILLPRDYDSVLPFARVDTFLNENDYRIHFCEFNGDGSAGMNENREITNSIVGSAPSAPSPRTTPSRAATCSCPGCAPSWTSTAPTASRWRTPAWPSATIWRTAWWTSSTSSPRSSARPAWNASWPTCASCPLTARC